MLGAGASKPYRFPLGTELREVALQPPESDLPTALSGIHDALTMQLPEFQSKLRAARRTSIDAFLEARPHYENLGKLVIAYHLIRCENENRLYSVKSEEDWYQYLIEMMLTDGFDKFGRNTLSIITYNYDRSLEYYMFHMLKEGYGQSDDACRDAMRAIPILHLHGQLGLLPELDDEGRPYESKVDERRLRLAANGIRIAHDESLDQDAVFTEARKLLSEARYVIFLGFGYLDKNVERLNLQVNRMKNTSYWGTGVKVTPSEAKQYARLFPENYSGDGPLLITIETGTKGVKAYIRNNLHLFIK
ncbi:MAG: SIR2 family protein [Planctomycetes bacterium]|nr:SIR2 family protein [Planctomycetota bacterium]